MLGGSGGGAADLTIGTHAALLIMCSPSFSGIVFRQTIPESCSTTYTEICGGSQLSQHNALIWSQSQGQTAKEYIGPSH